MSSNRRKETDLKVLSKSYNIIYDNPNNKDMFYVILKDIDFEPWKGGVWKVRFELPENYPFKSPSVGFVTKIWHPNICFDAGSICLDVLNTEWTPIFNLECIINQYIPLLLQNPNPDDPLNQEAAKDYKNNKSKYFSDVKLNIDKYCNNYDNI
jgi:ubiquitin-conjugating enzyme E2 H